MQQSGKPAYCSSWTYAAGSFLDAAGGYGKAAGTFGVVAGGAIGLSTAITGVGAGAGGAVAAGGASLYLYSAAVSVVGKGVKWLASGGNNFEGADVLGGLFEIPMAGRLGPASRVIVGNVADKLMGEGMGLKNPCGE